MNEREVRIQAGAILAAYGELTADYIIDRLCDPLGDRTAVEDWRRVAAAVDAITGAQSRSAN